MLNPLAKFITLAVQLLILVCVFASPVSAGVSQKTALGGYQSNIDVALGDVAHKSLNVLDNIFEWRTAALGISTGPDTRPLPEGYTELKSVGASVNNSDLPSGFRRVADQNGHTVVLRPNGEPYSVTNFVDGAHVVDIRTGKSYTGTADLNPTLDRIETGGSFPHRNDGSTFKNNEEGLPAKPKGYYTEYVHPTPDVAGPGSQRIVKGQNGELYYTPDHYDTFIRLDY